MQTNELDPQLEAFCKHVFQQTADQYRAMIRNIHKALRRESDLGIISEVPLHLLVDLFHGARPDDGPDEPYFWEVMKIIYICSAPRFE